MLPFAYVMTEYSFIFFLSPYIMATICTQTNIQYLGFDVLKIMFCELNVRTHLLGTHIIIIIFIIINLHCILLKLYIFRYCKDDDKNDNNRPLRSWWWWWFTKTDRTCIQTHNVCRKNQGLISHIVYMYTCRVHVA